MTLDTKYKRPTHTIHHKKSVGAHQKQDHRFLKTYWPYLPMFGIAAFVIVLGAMVLGPIGAVAATTTCVIAGVALIL